MRDEETPASEETREGETWPRRLAGFFEALGSLLLTRKAIFQEELGAKAGALGRAIGAFGLAAALALMSLLLLTAGIAALLSRLFGSPIAGILTTFALFAIAAAVAGWLGVKALSGVNLEFPVTEEEIRKDWEALRSSARPRPPGPSGGEGQVLDPSARLSSDDLEARFREGSE